MFFALPVRNFGCMLVIWHKMSRYFPLETRKYFSYIIFCQLEASIFLCCSKLSYSKWGVLGYLSSTTLKIPQFIWKIEGLGEHSQALTACYGRALLVSTISYIFFNVFMCFNTSSIKMKGGFITCGARAFELML